MTNNKGVHICTISGFAIGKGFFDKLKPLINESKSITFHDFYFNDILNLGKFAHQINQITAKYPTILFGHSMGGMILLLLKSTGLIKNIDKIALFGSSARMMEDYNYIGIRNHQIERMHKSIDSNKDLFMEKFFRSIITNNNKDNLESLIKGKQDYTAKQLNSGLKTLSNLDIRDDLDKITEPTLIIHGSADTIIPVSQAKFMSKKIKNSTYVEIPKMGHDMNLMFSKTIKNSIINFLFSNDAD